MNAEVSIRDLREFVDSCLSLATLPTGHVDPPPYLILKRGMELAQTLCWVHQADLNNACCPIYVDLQTYDFRNLCQRALGLIEKIEVDFRHPEFYDAKVSPPDLAPVLVSLLSILLSQAATFWGGANLNHVNQVSV